MFSCSFKVSTRTLARGLAAAAAAVALLIAMPGDSFAQRGGCNNNASNVSAPAPAIPSNLSASQSANISSNLPASLKALANNEMCTEQSSKRVGSTASVVAPPTPLSAQQNVQVNGSDQTLGASGFLKSKKLAATKPKEPQIKQTTNFKPLRTGPIGRLFKLDKPSIEQTTNIRG